MQNYKALLILLLAFLLSCASKENIPLDKNRVENVKDVEKDSENSSVIRNLLNAKSKDFDKCFDDEYSRGGNFSAKRVTSLFSLNLDGSLKASSVISIEPTSQEFKDCFKNIFLSLSFPKTVVGPKSLLIIYPVEYKKSAKN